MAEKTSGCCGSGCCCNVENPVKEILIDFLYLDLNTCGRCQDTDRNLEEAIQAVAAVLEAADFTVIVNKINVISKEMAQQYAFLSSPTIRINGNDIAMEVKESLCEDCYDLCGNQVDCRVWTYEGKDYTEPPKAMIVNAILKEIYSGQKSEPLKKEPYQLPYNLMVFFDGKKCENHSL